MVMGQTYEQARQRFHPTATDPGDSHWTSNEDLLGALEAAGFSVNIRVPCAIERLNTSVLVVRYPIGTVNFMHTVVWDAETQKILDPFMLRKHPLPYYQERLCLVFELEPGV
jgi:hypothetical protein